MNAVGNRIRLGEIEFKNRVFLASGPAGYGLEYSGMIDLAKLGGVVTKTISFSPRAGNPGRRLHETPSGLLNSVGLENVGSKIFFAEKLPRLLDAGVMPVVSLAGEDWDDFRRLIDATAVQVNVGAVELNLSCPNVERGGMAIGTNPQLLGKYVKHARDILGDRVVITKLTPNVQDIGRLALAAEEAGSHAVTAINTVLGMDIDITTGKPVFKRVHAGLSGPAILPLALDAVWKISATVDIPILGSGGISSVEDAVKFFMAGAAAVQIGTAIFYEPLLPERIVAALEENGVPAQARSPE